ncbi:MAG: hypothetical protein OXB88_07165 [Bacteriovoracales bacterium]|nr:hypothetical protein [Bacteriovoracales bacterium]
MMSTPERVFERSKDFKVSAGLLSLLSLLSLFAQAVTLILFFFQHPHLYFKDFPELEERASLKKTCYLAMKSILQKKASPALFHDSLLEKMREGDYGFFDFIGGEKIFDVVKNDSKGDCAVILTEKRGDRFFAFKFKDSDSRTHIYGRIVVRIDEITSNELTGEAL